MILDRYEAIQDRVNTRLDELDRVSENYGQARDPFTLRVGSLLSDLSALIQCENQLNFFPPWMSKFYHETKKCDEDLEWEYQKSMLATIRAQNLTPGTPVFLINQEADELFMFVGTFG